MDKKITISSKWVMDSLPVYATSLFEKDRKKLNREKKDAYRFVQ